MLPLVYLLHSIFNSVADRDYLGPGLSPLVPVHQNTPHGPDQTGGPGYHAPPLYLQEDAYCVACAAYVKICMPLYAPALSPQKAAERSLFTRTGGKRQE